MDSMDLDNNRPHKKRRFFTEDSSPVIQSIQRYTPPPVASPKRPRGDISSPVPIPSDGEEQENGDDYEGFDVGTLQAVVGELSPSVLQKLKTQSDNDVQRGSYAFHIYIYQIVTQPSNKYISRWIMERCTTTACAAFTITTALYTGNTRDRTQAARFGDVKCLYTRLRHINSFEPLLEVDAIETLHWIIWSRRLGHEEWDRAVET
jgi:hypothetical protein